jgi:predicted TIM-barrel fold metal-dependent hydrolase
MLDMPVDEMIDAHIHLFNLTGTPRPMQPLGRLFGWNEHVLRFMATRLMPDDAVTFFGPGTALLGDYMPADYRADASPSLVGRYVHVQAGWTDKRPLDPVGETIWLESLDDGPAAIVGHADLALGARVAPVLAAHNAASPRMRGIRHMLSWHENKNVMNHATQPRLAHGPTFRAGFDQLAEHGLSFDAWCYGAQIDEVSALAQHNPDVPMVLCHVGTPVGIAGEFGGIGVSEQERARIADAWRDAVSGLAQNGHVHCKLSGLLMPVLGFGYEHAKKQPTVAELVERLSPMVEHCIDAFGPQRCMIASNFPVDKVAVTYETMTKAMLEMTHRYGLEAQQAMFAGTAEAFYRIELR